MLSTTGSLGTEGLGFSALSGPIWKAWTSSLRNSYSFLSPATSKSGSEKSNVTSKGPVTYLFAVVTAVTVGRILSAKLTVTVVVLPVGVPVFPARSFTPAGVTVTTMEPVLNEDDGVMVTM